MDYNTTKMNADDALTIPPEYWLNRELSKIKDPKRRQWLAEKIFVGAEGYQKFLKIMQQRDGAHEFETGEWKTKLPKYKESELEQKRRPCIGCGKKIIPPLFSPWGELIEDFPAICPKCKKLHKPQNQVMSENIDSKAENEIDSAWLAIETAKQTLKGELKTMLDGAKLKLEKLVSPKCGYTFEGIFAEPEFSEIVEAFKISVKKTKPESGDTGKGSTKLLAGILEVMSDGKERKMSEIKAALNKKGIKTTNIHNKESGIGVLVGKQLKKNGKGRGTTYIIAKAK